MRFLGLFLVLFVLGAETLRAQGPAPARVPIASTSQPPKNPQPAANWAPQSPPTSAPAAQGRNAIATTGPQPNLPAPKQGVEEPPRLDPLPAIEVRPVPRPASPGTGGLVPVPPPPPPRLIPAVPPPAAIVNPDSLAPAVLPVPDDGLGRLSPPTPAPQPVVPVMAETKPPAAPQGPAVAPPTPEVPAVARASTQGPLIEKVGAEMQNLGKPFRYEIVVRNPSSTPLTEVRVQEELSAGARCLSVEPQAEVQGQQLTWNLDTLPPGAERRLALTVQPAGEGEFHSTAKVTCSALSVWRSRITRPALTVTKKGPEAVLVGEEVPFEITITNPGSGPATNVVIHDLMPSGLQHEAGPDIEADLGTLAAGESKTVPLKAKAVRSGRHVNEVVVTADGGLKATARAEVQVTEAGLKVTKTGPERACLRHELEHKLEVANTGEAPATSVLLTDSLPDGLDFVSATDGGRYDPATRAVSWNLATLKPGETRKVSVVMRGKTIGDWVNKATARADRGLESTASAPVSVEGVPALMLTVVDLDDPLEVGAETEYEIRVLNQGTSPVSGVAIRAVLPAELDLVRAEGPAPNRVQGREIVFDPVPKLAARADVFYKVRVKANRAGDLRFTTYLTSDVLSKPVIEEESTKVYDDLPDAPP